jgi:alpha-D-ribose 1-methylphosphonate 5-triphosphate synthase subunit PhnI
VGYVAVKGGANAIEASIARLREERLRTGSTLEPHRIRAGMRALIDQVMSEGSLYDEDVAALCLKQAEGSPEEAVFLLRALRSTLPRLHDTRVVDGADLRVERRISATFKDVPGGQWLGASTDYVHRLLDPLLATETDDDARAVRDAIAHEPPPRDPPAGDGRLPKVLDVLRREGLLPPRSDDDTPPRDVTTEPLTFPAPRSARLQVLTRAQTGALTALGYASLRGYGPMLHPTVGELRVGLAALTVADPGSDAASPDDDHYLGTIRITEVESVVPLAVERERGRSEIDFGVGYGVAFGQNETKAIAMSLLDQCLDHPDPNHPTHDEEFVLLHCDSVEATGFISHLKLPHYVTFASELDAVRRGRGGNEP